MARFADAASKKQAAEAGRRSECRGVDLRLEMALVDVPVADVENDRAEPEEHRKQNREEDDDLAALPSEAPSRAVSRTWRRLRP